MKTVKVRVAVAVDEHGDWSASGWRKADDKVAKDITLDGVMGEHVQFFWLTAELPVPEIPEIAAEVEKE